MDSRVQLGSRAQLLPWNDCCSTRLGLVGGSIFKTLSQNHVYLQVPVEGG